eukprot:Plantae.Rhodophyta-Purpureofilum_apyrenoidigerum.ctg4189.p1 GENE.Plantae.Rhodophyta-Purpureofilum_apyrenoidigerum.ctg4189~~Plantae.Rhodophyta-Purpureofilum_apyrenoidigerum.ctg4189.p1  ORF type:complete len:853 (+),score=162.21 Plantae.Rhodophyta-Purpureofilum_apyrenoidigerum.ctg4189:239-2560(+)
MEYKYVLVDDGTRETVFESETRRNVQFLDDLKETVIEGGIVSDSEEQSIPTVGQAETCSLPYSVPQENEFYSCEEEMEDEECYYETQEYEGDDETAVMSAPDAASAQPDEHQEAELLCVKQQLEAMTEQWYAEVNRRRLLFNQIQELRGNVRVFCRCRPPQNSNEVVAVEFPDHMAGKAITEVNRPGVVSLIGQKSFEFDRVFSPEEDQNAVYEDLAALVVSVLDGYNVCIFAYGQTGSGKTYTMNGTECARGINFRAIDDLFRLSDEDADKYSSVFSLSMLEIYNENLRDLFAANGPKLEIKRGTDQVFVSNLKWIEVQSVQEVWRAMHIGSQNRSSGATSMNAHSSRSHLVVSINVSRTCLATGEELHARLNLVDLAGSERLSRTNATGERLREAQHINKSLSALGDVFTSILAKNSHVPFRNSKLTYLLQDALGGDAKTLMLVNISPTESDAAETLSSLNFASRVSRAELGMARRNADTGDARRASARVAELEKENAVLVRENRQLLADMERVSEQLAVHKKKDEENYAHFRRELEESNKELSRRLREAEKAAMECSAYAEQNHKLQKQLRDAHSRLDVLDAMATQSQQKTPTQPSPAMPYQPPTRSILAELNRAAEDTLGQGIRSNRTASIRGIRNAGRSAVNLKSSIPRPRSSLRVPVRPSDACSDSSSIAGYDRSVPKTTTKAPKPSNYGDTRRSSQKVTRSSLQRLTRPTISSARSSSQPPTDDEVESIDSMRLTSARKPANYGTAPGYGITPQQRMSQRGRSVYI